MGKLHIALSVALLMAGATPAVTQTIAGPARQARPPADWAQAPSFPGVLVAHIDDVGKPMDLKADVWLGPKGPPTPLLLYIHGKGGNYNQPGDRIAALAVSLNAKGFAVATIDYRLSGRMPQMLFDTKAYIRYFRAHAAQYNIDPNRVAIWGTSRGGNLAAMLAVSGDVKVLEGDVGGNTDQSSKLNASVIESPLTDMFVNTDDKAASIFNDYLGTSDADSAAIVAAYREHDRSSPHWADVERIEAVNPLNYINKSSPLALITCGGHDTNNIIANCTAMFDKYIAAGADASYYAWAPGTHVRVGANIEDATVAWLVDKLGKAAPDRKS